MGPLLVPRAVLDAMRAHARAGSPQEVCGILAGRARADVRTVERAIPVRNAHPRPRSEYLLDPEEHLRATLAIEDELGLDVVGFYHSHPAGPPRLSATDAARASWPGASYFLLWLRPDEGHLSARWDEARRAFEPEDVIVGE